MRLLISGGCGYIGSHMTMQITAQSAHDVYVLDNLSTGFKNTLPTNATFWEVDLRDKVKLKETLKDQNFDAVIHFAASTVVPESVANPLKYYENNTIGTVNLLESLNDLESTKFIFSSTAAVYGDVSGKVDENDEGLPVSPYGWSKKMDEIIIRDVASATGMKYAILRYFNVAGAHISGKLGQQTKDATHLIKVACEAACGKRDRLQIYGNDYATPDGTCVRDYIHVQDLADAHLQVLKFLNEGGESDIFNCGYGHGYSVKEVIDMVKKVSAKDFKVEMTARRPGDIAEIIANNAKIVSKTNWQPQFDSLETIVKTAYEFEKSLGG